MSTRDSYSAIQSILREWVRVGPGESAGPSPSEGGPGSSVQVTYGRSVNVLCLCGAIIGVAAALSSWVCYSEMGYSVTVALGEYIQPSHYDSFHPLLFYGGMLFVVGTLLSFLTPLSGIVQGTGLSLFAVDFLGISAHLDDVEVVLRTGFYAGIVSAALVLASLFVPMGPGFGSVRHGFRHRLSVFRGARPGRNVRVAQRLRAIETSALAQRKWASLLVAVILASAVMVFHDRDFFREEEALVPIMGGVQLYPCSPDLGLFAGGAWESYRVSLYEGDSGVGWTFQSDGLDGGTWSALSLGTGILGDLNVSLTVIDVSGDGIVHYGDSLVFTVNDGAAFSDDVVYRLFWKTNRSIAWTGWEVSFVFHEGHLDSWVSKVVRYGL